MVDVWQATLTAYLKSSLQKEEQAILCMDMKVTMLTVNFFPSKVITAGVEISLEVEIIIFFYF